MKSHNLPSTTFLWRLFRLWENLENLLYSRKSSRW